MPKTLASPRVAFGMPIVNFGLGAGARGTAYTFMESRLRMAAPIQPQHDLSAIEIDEIEEWIYNYNQRPIGRNDARGLGLVISRRGGTHDRGRRWIFLGRHFRTQTDVDR